MSASAPGKLLLSGEYAVLEGAPAIVAAVQARAFARFEPGTGGPDHPEGAAARRLAEARYGAVAGRLSIDASALRAGDVKLGLGSSAAIAAACAAAVAAQGGRALVPSEIFELALEGHRAVSPEGSGADVAASVFGGLIHFRRADFGREARLARGAGADGAWPATSDSGCEVRSLSFPPELAIRVVWTGHAARTSDFIRRVSELESARPEVYGIKMGALRDRAEALAEAFVESRAAAIVEAAGAYGEAMGALGDAADVPIVEARLAQVDALARRFGGRAKPSGAGGGDVAVAFFSGEGALSDFDEACRSAGLVPVDRELGGAGVSAC